MKILRIVVLLCIPLGLFASVTSQVEKSGPFLITASPQTIATGFPFVSSSELLVLDTGTTGTPRDPAVVLTLGSDYTVTGGGYNGSNQMQAGSVIVVSSGTHSVITGDYIVIMRNVPLNQTSSFTTTGPNTVLLLEQMGDKLATLSQQVNQIGSRSLRFENFEFLDGTLVKSARAGNILAFDANGAVTYIPTSATPGGYVLSITGTANEITASQAQGAVTLSLPTAVTFTGKTVTGGTFNAVALSANANAVALPAGLSGTILQLGQADSVNTRFTMDGFGAAPIINMRRSGGTNASKTATTSGEILGAIGGIGYGTSAYSTGSRASINLTASENFTNTAQGSKIELNTTPIGSVLLAVAVTIKDSGIVNIVNTPNYANNAAAISGGLVSGDVYRNGDVLQIVH